MQTVFERKKTPVTMLTLAIGLALQMQPVAALAQQAAESAAGATTQDGGDAATQAAPAAQQPAASGQEDIQDMQTVVATATYRASLEKALDIKRGEKGMVDAIVAEDIGKFPDLNLAESLQRVPGVTIARDAGEGRNISVRGLGADFTRVRLNGLEALTTTGGTDSSGGANRGRGFDFNAFASELFSQLIVRKTPSAEIEEGSLGATVDLRTARPFDYGGFTFSASALAGYNDLSDNGSSRMSALISNTWADGRFGALLSVAYTDRKLIEEGSSTVRWDPSTANGGFDPASPYTPALANDVFHPRIPRYGVMRHDQQRLGVTSSLQFKPGDNTLFTLDMMYAKFDATRTEDYIEAVSFSRSGSGKPATIVRDGEVDGHGNLVYGVFDNVDIRSESRYDELSTEFQQINLLGEHRFSDDFKISGLVGHSESEHDNPIQTTVIMDKLNAQGYTYDYRGDSRLPSFNYGSVDVNDPNGWALAEIRLRPQWIKNTFDTGQLDFAWTVSPYFTLKGGVQAKEYQFSSREWRRASETAVPTLTQEQRDELNKQVELAGINVSGNPSRWVVPDIDAYNRLLNLYSNSGLFAVSDRISGVAGNNRKVTEKNRGFYLQGDFSLDLGSIPLSGNIGVRHVKTEQISDGVGVVGSALVPVSVRRDYSDTLPSLNLVAEITPDFLIRFAAAKVMARPGLGNIGSGVTVNVSGGNRTITAGNPFLDPFRATTYDLGFEWYFDEGALLGVGLFYKDIDSFVQTTRENRVFNTIPGLDPALLEGTTALPTDEFQYNYPVNTEGGPLQGVELNYQQPFRFLPGLWSNLGVQFSYTYVDSKIQYTTSTGVPTIKTDLLGLSKHSYAATLYYEGEKLSARVSTTVRDDYLTTAPGRNNTNALPVGPGNNDVEGTKGTTTVDASLSWKLTDQWQLSLEGTNLTDEWNDQWIDSAADRPVVYTHTGRQYMLGVRYKF
ncbi:TonB-dependent receptor [Luteimonas panaciterrae]|uniref:TonB-dependent receptor n=1 Tax=Luteimonas panaciterrae TaxID=363885 RepID=UPI001CFA458B|nr:TonB-dependent receptor [Luteimonas panaciterrae]